MQHLDQLLSGRLTGAKHLKLSCGLTTFPPEILELSETLEYLDLSGNHLNALPEDFSRLRHLKIAFFSNNDFTTFPIQLAACKQLDIVGFKANKIVEFPEDALPAQLRWLILTDNHISSLPASLGRCHRMQKLMLAGNKLQKLPDDMADLKNLELLRISANQIQALPSWLLKLPKLSWLAFAGNPCAGVQPQSDNILEIDWNNLRMEQLLGEGASGHIYQAHYDCNGQDKRVAVKIFKGAVTSDGLPADEMTAYIAAGTQDHIVPLLGKIRNHPEQKQGLVLELIPPAYKNLGGPPDFKTCTRDTFLPETNFNMQAVMHISRGIAAASSHLHARQLMHGDLYAHNILIDEKANALVGDFGAASCFGNQPESFGAAMERLEVRAYGCLLDDLLTHLHPEDKEHPSLPSLQRLKTACMGEEIMERPAFKEIQTILAAMDQALAP